MNKEFSQSHQSPDVFDETLVIMDELATVMADEVVVLAKQDIKAHKELMLKKNKLMMAYQTKMKTIMTQPDAFKQLPEPVKASLKTTGTKLAHVADCNASALRTAVQCSERLILHIIRHVKEEVMPKKGYSNPRKLNDKNGSYSPLCPPVAVTRTA